MKSIIFNPFTPIPKSTKSHVRGWSMIWAQRLQAKIYEPGDSLTDYKTIYIDHGVNFSGTLNLFGGADAGVADRCSMLIKALNYGCKLVYLDRDFDYPSAIASRLSAKTTDPRFKKSILDDLKSSTLKRKIVTMEDLRLDNLIIGDSHSPAFSHISDAVIKMNGTLLFSTMSNRSLVELIANYKRKNKRLSSVSVCLGSIDIRFHALKPGRQSAKQFAVGYSDHLKAIASAINVKPIACYAVPVEHEDRRIPKSGWYKGKPYFGSRADRLEYTTEFNHWLSKKIATISPPKDWYTMDGKQYADEIMELNSSFHVAPIHYRSIRGW